VTRRQARAVLAAAGACLLLALALWLAPLRLPSAAADAQVAAFAVDPPAIAGEAVDPRTYQPIVEGNVLSPTREPPELRTAADTVEAPAPPPRVERAPQYRLVGLIRARDGYMALIDADPNVPGAEVYRLGDQVGPYHLVEANDTSVTLRGPPGTQVLKLDPLPGRTP
jgi:hypothetical protein